MSIWETLLDRFGLYLSLNVIWIDFRLSLKYMFCKSKSHSKFNLKSKSHSKKIHKNIFQWKIWLIFSCFVHLHTEKIFFRSLTSQQKSKLQITILLSNFQIIFVNSKKIFSFFCNFSYAA